MNKLVQWILNITAGVFFFVFFLIIFFPFDNIIYDALAQIEEKTNGKYRIQVSEINPNIFFKSIFKDFEVFRATEKGDLSLIYFPVQTEF